MLTLLKLLIFKIQTSNQRLQPMSKSTKLLWLFVESNDRKTAERWLMCMWCLEKVTKSAHKKSPKTVQKHWRPSAYQIKKDAPKTRWRTRHGTNTFASLFLFKMSTISIFLLGLLLALIGYIAYVKIPSMSNSVILHFDDQELQHWIQSGRYHNFNGYSIFYKDSIGDAGSAKSKLEEIVTLPVILIIHGYPSFSYDFQEQYTALSAQNYHVVAVDMLGFGLSDKPHDIDYTMGIEAKVMESVLKSVFDQRALFRALFNLPIEENIKYSILAHDLGDSVGQELIARQLDRTSSQSAVDSFLFGIHSVVLLNGGLFPDLHRKTTMQGLIESSLTGPLIQLLSTAGTMSKGLSAVFGPDTQPSAHTTQLYWDALSYKDGILIIHKLQQYISERRRNKERLVNAIVEGSLTIKMCFINGPADPVSGRHMAVGMQELLSEERVKVVILGEKIGHYPQLEDPVVVTNHVVDFFSKHRV